MSDKYLLLHYLQASVNGINEREAKGIHCNSYSLCSLFNKSNLCISSLASKLPVQSFSYCSSYLPVDSGALPLSLLVISTIPLLQSRNAFIWAIHSSGKYLFKFGSSKHFCGLFLSIITQGDLCKQIATAFF